MKLLRFEWYLRGLLDLFNTIVARAIGKSQEEVKRRLPVSARKKITLTFTPKD